MFKNYLSYQMALSFERNCLALGLEHRLREQLMRSSRNMAHHFARSLHSKDGKEVSKFLFVALVCLRDCREVLDEAQWKDPGLDSQYEVLHARLEQLCLAASETEQGQLRMLG